MNFKKNETKCVKQEYISTGLNSQEENGEWVKTITSRVLRSSIVHLLQLEGKSCAIRDKA